MNLRSAVDDARIGLVTMARSGLLRPVPPLRLMAAGAALRRWGVSYAGGFAAAAAQHPDRPCVIDERGQLTWRDVDRRSDALAQGLRALGVGPSDGVGVLCRNHRGFVEITAALSKLGTTTIYLNTGFAGPQLRDVLAREGTVALVADQEFTELVGEGAPVGSLVFGWIDKPAVLDDDALTIDGLVATSPVDAPPRPPSVGRTVVLTSGTTGTPKGAPRAQQTGIGSAVAMLDRIPYRQGDVTVLPAPLFHSWGLGNMSLGLLLGSTFVLRRRFDPESVLADIARHRARVLAAVPVMLQRILELPTEVRRCYDTSSLEVVSLSGSAIPGDLATRWMDAFGDNIYNLYGSTEVGWATIATPEDLRADPTTAGRPPLHTTVRLLDEHDRDVPAGETGRIFVGSEMLFEGYTGGGSKEVVDGLMSTGDTGRFDEHGRLHVEGREDDMIVSGGENVMPREIEELLADLPDVVEVAVVGIPDAQFGQRLRAVVVRRDHSMLDEATVRAHVREHLAGYKVPREVVFIDELPRNATGKVLTRSLMS
jgi:fatty-acyl-CoA synthase